MLVELRSKAEAATPGRWFYVHDTSDPVKAWVETLYGKPIVPVGMPSEDLAYIAAVSPDRVLALLDRLDEAAEMMQRVTDGGSVSVEEMERWLAAFRVAKDGGQ